MAHFYRADDDRLLDDQDRDRPPVIQERSHQGQQVQGCFCDDCQETRARLKAAMDQAVAEQAERDADIYERTMGKVG